MPGKRGTTRTHRCPPSHKHEKTGTCFNQHGCGCFPCVEGRRVYQLERDRQIAYGRWDTDRVVVDATGTRRRLQALAYMGWSSKVVAAQLNTRDSFVRELWRAATCHRGTADRVRDFYARVWAMEPPGGRRAVTANLARREGWVGPLHWDNIDDPNETPEVVAESTWTADRFDETIINAAMQGERPPLSPAERRHVISILNERRWSETRIANHLGCARKTVGRIRSELGLPVYLASGTHYKDGTVAA